MFVSSIRASNAWLMGLGCLFLLYALLGNYIALPGYIRFIERGGTSEAGNAFDMAVLIGAIKTIAWMYSFQIGVLCLTCAYAIARDLHTRAIVVLGLVWLGLWSWPSLPQPGAWFYVTFGSLLLVLIAVSMSRRWESSSRLSESLFTGALVFFAFATWEVCGLGTTGRMLHPEESAGGLALNLLVTQSSKLMIEFVLAWSLVVASMLVKPTS